MKYDYPKEVTEISKLLLDEIEKHFPGITKKKFDNCGYPDKEGSCALERAKLCIYIELLKAGIFYGK